MILLNDDYFDLEDIYFNESEDYSGWDICTKYKRSNMYLAIFDTKVCLRDLV